MTPSTGTIKFGVKGKNGAYPIPPSEVPGAAPLVLDVLAAAEGQCVTVAFPAAPPARPGEPFLLYLGHNLRCHMKSVRIVVALLPRFSAATVMPQLQRLAPRRPW